MRRPEMGWSLNAVGKPAPVLTKLAADIADAPVLAPEDAVRQAAWAAIQASLNAQSPNIVVKVAAEGHQSEVYSADGHQQIGWQNSASINIELIQGFVG